jgi:hypothetical protein
VREQSAIHSDALAHRRVRFDAPRRRA